MCHGEVKDPPLQANEPMDPELEREMSNIKKGDNRFYDMDIINPIMGADTS